MAFDRSPPVFLYRRQVEAALSGTLPLTELSDEERLVANAEADATIAERLRTR